MPTTKYIHKPDDYLSLTFRLTYSLDERGRFGAIDRVTLIEMADSNFPNGIPPDFAHCWETIIEQLYYSELAVCVQADIEAARIAEQEHRAKLAMENEQ